MGGTKGSKMKIVAVYDFDGTITDRHTFWRFLRELIGPVRFWSTVITMIPWVIGIYYRGASIMDAREVLIRRVLRGIPVKDFEQKSEEFSRLKIPQWVRSQALESIRGHLNQGNELILISNSAKSYLEPWAKTVGINVVFGSEFDVDENGRLTGYLRGKHCQGEEKLICMKRYLGSLKDYEIHVYGDSDGDVEMLNVADFAYYQTFDVLHRNDQRLCV